MAKEKKAKPPKPPKPPGKGGIGPGVLVLLGLSAGVLLSYAMATALLLGLGLLPSLIAFALDPTPGRPGARAVFFLNLCGLLPTLADFWRAGQGLSGSMALLGDWRTLGLAWGAAALGFLLKSALPMIAGFSVDSQAHARRIALEARRDALAAEWGRGGEP